MRTEAHDPQTGNAPESGHHRVSKERLSQLVSGCFASGCSGPDELARHVMHAVAHDLEMLVYAVSTDELERADVERSLILAYERLRAGADLARLLENAEYQQSAKVDQ